MTAMKRPAKKRKGVTTARPVVIVRCVQCRQTRTIEAGEIPKGDVPMCGDCYAPMIAVRAELRQDFL